MCHAHVTPANLRVKFARLVQFLEGIKDFFVGKNQKKKIKQDKKLTCHASITSERYARISRMTLQNERTRMIKLTIERKINLRNERTGMMDVKNMSLGAKVATINR